MEKSIVVAKCNPRYAFMVTGVTHIDTWVKQGRRVHCFLFLFLVSLIFFPFIRTHSFRISAAFRETGR